MGPYPNPTVNYQAGYYPRTIDIGAVMRQVYLWLAIGLGIGFGIAFALGHAVQPDLDTLRTTGYLPSGSAVALLLNPVVVIVSLLAYIIIGFTFFPIVQRASVGVSSVLYIIFAAIFGLFTATAFLQYKVDTILSAFVATAGMFAVMSLIGFTTRLDLSKLGAILFMALIGLILASVVNLFVNNPTLYWIVTYAGVLIFCGLIAYDTQWIKRSAAQVSGSAQAEARLALMGAFKLFLDFVNLFWFMLRILGGGRGLSRR